MGYRQEITKGATSHLATVTIRRTDTGQLKTGLAFGDMTIGYLREGAASLASVTPVTMTAGTWASGGWVEVGSGVYQFGVPNAALAAGAHGVEFLFQAAGAIDQTLTIVLQDVDHRDAVRFGLSALPNAAAGAVGGLPVEDANGNIPVDLARWLGDVPLALVSQLVQAQANQLGAQAKLDVNAEADTALADYDPPTRAELTSDKNEIITEVNANETKIDLLETKAQADTRQTALIAEHDATQGKVDALQSDFDAFEVVNQNEHDATQVSVLTRAAPGDAMALTSVERDSVANALLDLVDAIESGLTPRAALRIILASQAGKLSGAGTSTIRIRDVADTKDRIVGTVDGIGNRTATTVDGD